MGLHARMLVALGAALLLTMAMAGAASATTDLVRVETPQFVSAFSTLVDRTPVEVPAVPIVKADKTDPTITATCAPDSPAALLSQAIGIDSWDAAVTPAVPPALPTVSITRIKNAAQPTLVTPTWDWVVFLGDRYVRDPCNSTVPNGGEALFYPLCRTTTPVQQAQCFTGGALQMRISPSSYLEVNPWIVPGVKAPISVNVLEAVLDRNTMAALTQGSTDTTVSTDEGASALSNDDHHEGIAVVGLSALGDHVLRAYEAGKVPTRMKVCATDGQDGFCGTTVPDHNPYVEPPSPCTTNGHDGECGTQDTSGPPTHVTTIRQKQVISYKKAPSTFKGTIDADRNGVKDVQFRLTRVSTAKVRIKAKKKKSAKKRTTAKKSAAKKKPKVRYRTIKRCTYWSDDTLLFEAARHCGTKYGKWYPTIVDDVPTAFHYDFDLKLPKGTYTLEVRSRDGNGYPEDTEVGRNVLTFTVR